MQKLYRIANVFGLNADNLQHTVAITDAVTLLDRYDLDDFLDFARGEKALIQFATNVERLDIITRKFVTKKEEEQFSKIEKQVGDFIAGILRKIQFLKTRIKNAREEYSLDIDFNDAVIINDDGSKSKFFTNKELKAIEKVGSTRYVIECYEDWTLSDKLRAVIFEEYAKKQKVKALPSTNDEVMAILPKAKKI